MIDYIINYDEELTNKKIQIRYPFMISEIMGSENTKLIDYLFGKFEESETEEIKASKDWEILLPKLFSFLDRDSICMTAAGYFNKAIITILRRRGFDVAFLFLSFL
jgi:serine/threonine-protein phosphatase 6 regulatory subunit 3